MIANMVRADKRDTFLYVSLGALIMVALAAIFPDKVLAKTASEYTGQCANIIYPEGAGPQTEVTSDSLAYYRGAGVKGGNPVCLVKASGSYVTLEPIDLRKTPFGQGLIVYHNDSTKLFVGPPANPMASRVDVIPFASCSRVLSDIRCIGNLNAGGVATLKAEMKDKELHLAVFELEKNGLYTPDPASKILGKVDYEKPIFLLGKDFRVLFKQRGGMFGGVGVFRTDSKETSQVFSFLAKQEDDYRVEVALPSKSEEAGGDTAYRAIAVDKKQLFFTAQMMRAIGRQFASE